MESHGTTRLTVVWILAGVALVPIVLVVIAVFSMLWTTGRAAGRAEQAIREAGEPLTLAELDAWYPYVPDEENAALIYERAFRKLAAPRYAQADYLPVAGYADLPPPGQPLPKVNGLAVAQYLADNEEALDLFHQAAQRDACSFPIDLRAGMTVELPRIRRAT